MIAEWTVSVERAPLGVGCEPLDSAFPARHEGNYFALGHPTKERFGMTKEQWDRTAARTAGCLRVTAVPKVKNESCGVSHGCSSGSKEHLVWEQALESFVTPMGFPILPNGTVLNVPAIPSADRYRSVGAGMHQDRVSWGPGDLFGSSYVQLPAELASLGRAPLDDGAPVTMHGTNRTRLRVVSLQSGELVTLVRPPPVRVHSSRLLVGAPRAWAGSGRRGALAIVDVSVDLLERPIAIDAKGRTVIIDDTDTIDGSLA